MKGMGRRVLVAMSGGVDSSAAVYLLREQGYDCVRATMELYGTPADAGGRPGGGGADGHSPSRAPPVPGV